MTTIPLRPTKMGAVFLRNGADDLAVADLSEGVRLRRPARGA